MVEAKYRYQVEVQGQRSAHDRFATPTRAKDVANGILKRKRGNRKPDVKLGIWVRVIDLANSRVLGESRDGSPIRKLKD